MRKIGSSFLVLLLAAIMIFNLSGCSAVYGVFAPKDYKAVKDTDYPDDAIPLYDGAVIYSYKGSGNEIKLKAGSADDFADVAEFYMDEFENEGYVLFIEKDRSNEYIAEGYKGKYSFIFTVGTPDDKWEKRLYSTVISIDLTISNLGNKDELNSYIALVREDMDLINKVFADKDSMNTAGDIEQLYAFVSDLFNTISEQKTLIEQRTVPEIEALKALHNNERLLYARVYDIFAEYTQMLDYALTLMDMANEFFAVAELDSNDVNEIYTALSNSVENSITLLENADVPTFLQNLNERYLESIRQMDAAVLFTLIGVDMLDPVRMDAGEYSMDIVNREFQNIAEAANRDMEDRKANIDQDIEAIKGIIGGWSLWLDGAQEAVDSNADSLKPIPAELLLDNVPVEISCVANTPDFIIPANYRSLDYVAYLECWTNHGSAEAMVTVEIPGFTQKYEQMITLNRAECELVIRPPLLDNASDNLNSSKEAQLIITVQNLTSGELVMQETRDVTLYSRYDMQWVDAQGVPYDENILAWVTPEAPEIKQLLRDAADSAEYLTDGQLSSIVGYQYAVSDWSEVDITYTQVCAVMHAMASTIGVKYVMTPFSSTDISLQRIATPAEVLLNKSGICVETAVTVASALQSMGMHPVLILLPGHMQTAVETWYGSGEYLLIETTALTDAANENFDNVVYYLTPEEWAEYLARDGYTVIDCEFMGMFGIKSID